MIVVGVSRNCQVEPMKWVVEIMKALQTGGIFGSVAVPLIASDWQGRNPGLISFNTLEVIFLGVVLVCSSCLAAIGEWKRARNGVILTVILFLIVAGLSAPLVIR